MQSVEKIRNEIANTNRQISLAEMKIEIAPEAEKDEWRAKLAAHQARLEELEAQLEIAEKEALMGDIAENEAPLFDDKTADDLLNDIIFSVPDEGTDASSSYGDFTIDENNADDILSSILSTPDYVEPQSGNTTDVMADAMLDSILSASEPKHAVIDDATADAMIDTILSAPNPADEVVLDDATANDLLNTIIFAAEPEENSEPIAEDGEPIILGDTDMPDEPILAADEPEEPVVVQDEDPIVFAMPPEEPYVAESYEEPVAYDEVIESAPVENEPVEEEPITEAESAEHEPAVEEEPEQPKLSVDEMADAILEKILSATDNIANERKLAEEFAAATAAEAKKAESTDARDMLEIEKLKLEAQEANRKAQAALYEAEKMRDEAARIKLAAETERAMYAAEMELQRGLRNEEENMRAKAEQAEKDRLAEKIARRKAEITAIRNGLQDVKDTDSAFLIREKLFSVQLVLDEDERNSPEISYLLTKSMDDVSHSLEVAELKRRIAALVAIHKAPPKKKAAPPAKKKASAKKAKKKAAPKKKKVIVVAAPGRRAPVMARPYPPARRRYVMRPSHYSPRYMR